MATRSTRSAPPAVVTLAELLGPGVPFTGQASVVSVYAVVTSGSAVMGPTAIGKDAWVVLQLRDPTLPRTVITKAQGSDGQVETLVETVTCQVFAPGPHLLPQYEGRREHPEVLCLHAAKKNLYNGAIQLQARIRPAKTTQDGDMYAVYASHQVPGRNVDVPLKQSHDKGTPFQADMQRVNELREWVRNGMVPAQMPVLERAAAPEPPAQAASAAGAAARAAGSSPTVLMRLCAMLPPVSDFSTSQLLPGSLRPVDVICRVLAVDFSRCPEHYVLHVWDGTDVFPLPLSYSSEPGPAPAGRAADGAPAGGGAAAAGVAAAADGPRRSQRKRARDGADDEAASSQPQGGAAGGAEGPAAEAQEEDADPLGGPCAPPDCCRLLMPLASIVQFGDSDSGGGGAGEGGGAGWEVLSSSLPPHEMPVAGGAVPVVLPADLFTLEPPTFASSGAGGKGGALSRAGGAAGAPEWGAARGKCPLPRPGDFIKLKNVVPRFVRGQLQLVFTAASYYTLRTAQDMVRGLAEYNDRIRERPPTPPQKKGDGQKKGDQQKEVKRLHALAPLKEDDLLARAYPDSWRSLPLKTLRQVLLQQATCDVSPARVYARVVAVLRPGLPPAGAPAGPADEEALRRAVMAGGLFQLHADVAPGSALDTSGSGASYGLALLLQDATATLRAVAVGSAANLLLWHIPPPAPTADGAGAATLPAIEGAATQHPQPGPREPPLEQDEAPTPGASVGEGGVRTRARAAKGQPQPPALSQAQGRDKPRRGQGRKSLGALQEGSPLPKPQLQPHSQPQQQGPPARQQHKAKAGAGAAWWAPLQDDSERLRLLAEELHCLANQDVACGSWIECVLRPMYRSRSNPWQSAVYGIEHTVLRGTPAAKAAAAAGAAPPAGAE
ncbi:hypothetical protein HXX76_012748 [Chlamydomonas incerta]|uniref:Telomeric single stranded DNA binding POT1/Cdc13 domain-containing protein n=1 Tax=Chlamydomonas incerta TaxID=51695 RepID=A0A835SNT3_CHLIN|nr:hypothetical protein HXX76_012748 [Chlamydomonas incerta]|eukprot:KAG2426963.1 hypothetical protein HXX76_012748 [Chlamydomonas incerta]